MAVTQLLRPPTGFAHTPPPTLAALFEAQVARTPTAAAVVAGNRTLDYAGLDAAATRLAAQLSDHLKTRGVGAEAVVGIALGRSIETIVAVLAVLKAGAACLPLDPALPPARLAYMLRDAAPACVLTTAAIAPRLGDAALLVLDAPHGPAPAGGPVPQAAAPDDLAPDDLAPDTLAPDTLAPDTLSPDTLAPDTLSLGTLALDPLALGTLAPGPLALGSLAPDTLAPNILAYVIYTSGSTGQPKAVGMTLGALLNLVVWQSAALRRTAGARVLQFAPLGFDVAFQEILTTLAGGGCLVMIAEDDRTDPARLLRLMTAAGVTRAFLPPVVLQALAEAWHPAADLRHLRDIVVAGEPLRLTPAIRAMIGSVPGLRLHNHYGPSETHVTVTHTLPDPAAWRHTEVPIGVAIRNTTLHVLDAALAPVAVGAVGELYIAGASLARGYLNRPGLTAERFIACPFGPPGARMYRTGDLARRRADGALDCLGRVDQQVKIRGFRIEPGEIEAALEAIEGIGQAAVVARDIAGDARLIAYLVPRSGGVLPATARLRAALAERLPNYMLPAAFVRLDRLPLTANGKLDRPSLPAPPPDEDLAPPLSSAIEQRLLGLWQAVLGRQAIDRTADFFELGGHSLLALRLLTLIETAFGQRLGLPSLFRAPTIAALGRLLERRLLDEGTDDGGAFHQVERLYPDEAAAPLFGINSTGAYYHLGKVMGPALPMVGLQVFNPDAPPATAPDSIREIAAGYVRLIREIQPAGPYRLFGWSIGAVVAYEVAWQLEAADDVVAFLGILDNWAPGHAARLGRVRSALFNGFYWLERQGYALKRLPATIAESMRVARGTQEPARFVASHPILARSLGLLRRSMAVAPLRRDPSVEHEYWLVAHLVKAAERYVPGAFSGRIHVFRAAVARRTPLHADPLMGWPALAAGGVESIDVTGDHDSMLRPPGVDQMAAAMLAAARATDA